MIVLYDLVGAEDVSLCEGGLQFKVVEVLAHPSLFFDERSPYYPTSVQGEEQLVHLRGESAKVGTNMTGKHLDGLGLDIDIMFMKILRDEGCDLIVVETFTFVDDADLLNGFGSGFACVEFAVLVAKDKDCCGVR